jgi:hypothetical protein
VPHCLSLIFIFSVLPHCLLLIFIFSAVPHCLSLIFIFSVLPHCLLLIFIFSAVPHCLSLLVSHHPPPQSRLAEQSDIAVAATSRSEQLEEDISGLKAELSALRRSASISAGSPLESLSAEQAQRERALTEQLAAAEVKARAAAAEREATRARVLQLETELRQKDARMEEAMASAAGGRDKQVRQHGSTYVQHRQQGMHDTAWVPNVQHRQQGMHDTAWVPN